MRNKFEELAEMKATSEREGFLLRPVDAAAVLGVSRQRVRKLMEGNRLRIHEFFGKVWVNYTDVKAFADSGRKSGRQLSQKKNVENYR